VGKLRSFFRFLKTAGKKLKGRISGVGEVAGFCFQTVSEEQNSLWNYPFKAREWTKAEKWVFLFLVRFRVCKYQ
jgi:hypothetical protein